MDRDGCAAGIGALDCFCVLSTSHIHPPQGPWPGLAKRYRYMAGFWRKYLPAISIWWPCCPAFSLLLPLFLDNLLATRWRVASLQTTSHLPQAWFDMSGLLLGRNGRASYLVTSLNGCQVSIDGACVSNSGRVTLSSRCRMQCRRRWWHSNPYLQRNLYL